MKKQVIFIMVDTQRTDMLGCYGNDGMHTPNLDKLASQGLRYTNAQTCQPVCAPARGSIFTGLYPHANGIVTNSCGLYENVKTVGQRLTDNGVYCAYVGKWHLDGGDYFGTGICPEGWDENYWYDMRRYLEEMSEEDRRRSRKSKTSFDPTWTEDMTFAHRCTNKALSFLDDHSDEDFFFTLSYDEPHGPCICPAPYNTMYDGYKLPVSENFDDDLDTKTLMQRLWSGQKKNLTGSELNVASDSLSLFLGCNSYVDSEIGRFLEQVYAKCPDALIIYTADHGDMLWNHKINSKNSCGYKEVLNIPLMIKGGATGVVDHPASHIDVVPTILDYMNVPLPKWLDGKSMLPQIQDGTTKINDYVFSEFTRYELIQDGNGGFQPMRLVFDGRYKLVVNLLDSDELYDLDTDPAEVHNLIDSADHATIRNQLHDVLLAQMDTTRDIYRGFQWACRPWREDKAPSFRNAGYVRQLENEEYEPRQLEYDTGMPMVSAVRTKILGADKKP
ncbi:sulfatase-like hydrolase/transferase [Bengtsoniella intestinalis]|uniref:sulfatase-like hydrolase/transferase n=1 Tax=Bengtsoniella intestinalis TaxID=3073143 RepID=UPI00391FA520